MGGRTAEDRQALCDTASSAPGSPLPDTFLGLVTGDMARCGLQGTQVTLAQVLAVLFQAQGLAPGAHVSPWAFSTRWSVEAQPGSCFHSIVGLPWLPDLRKLLTGPSSLPAGLGSRLDRDL